MKKRILLLMAFVMTATITKAQIDRSKMPDSGPTPEIKLVEPYTFKLKNGLQVLVVTDNKLPTINFSLNLNTPPVFEGDKAGVQSLTGSIMGKGTKTMSKEDFNEEVDFLGAFLTVNTNGGFVSTLSKYKEQVFKMFVDAALNPNFTQKELDFEKEQLIAGIKSGENSAAAIAGKVRSALVYGTDHPAGEFATEESINSVTLQDLEAFYKANFVPSKGYLVISGDIKGKEAKKLVNKYLGKWSAGTLTTPTYPEVKDVPYTQINFVDVPNAVQTELAVYNVAGLKMNDKDYHAALVTNSILGGSFGSYLNMNLREKNGYTYGARSGLGANRYYNSTFSASAKVRNEVTDSAVVETMSEIERIRNTYVDDKMLETAKAQYLGNFIMSSEDKEVVADRAITIKTNNLPEDFYKNFIANINAVTKEDVKRIANKYLKVDNMRIVLVGKASDVLENLEKMEINGKTVPIKFFDKDGKPTEKPSGIEVPKGVTVTTVLDTYIKAHGGKEAMSKIKSTNYIGELATPNGNLTVTEKRALGDKWMQKVEIGGATVQEQKYDGTTAKVAGQVMTGAEAMAIKSEAIFMPEITLTSSAKLMGAELFEGTKAYVVTYGSDTKHYYDMQTGVKLGNSSKLVAQGQELNVLINYADYKAVDGVMFPMTISQSVAGQNFQIAIKTMETNKNVSDADFK